MSNITIFSGSSAPIVPTELDGEFSNNSLFDLTRSTGVGSKRISIRGNKFRMQINGEEVGVQSDPLEVVILGSSPNFLRQYYARPYDPKDTSPPDCWSNDNVRPHEFSAKQQASACSHCSKNIAGSGAGTTKACQTKANIAVVLANNIQNGDIFEMTIPAQSLFTKFDQNTNKGGLLGYSNYLDARKVDPRRVITKIEFDDVSATPLVWFSGKDWVAQEDLATVAAKSNSEEAKRALVFSYRKPTPEASPASEPTPSMFDKSPPQPKETAPSQSKSGEKVTALMEEWGEEV